MIYREVMDLDEGATLPERCQRCGVTDPQPHYVTYPRLKPVGLSLALHGLGASETLGG